MARAGRFGTKGLAVTFVSDETDAKTLNDVQDRFEVNVAELPEEIDISTYSKWLFCFYKKPGLQLAWPPPPCVVCQIVLPTMTVMAVYAILVQNYLRV